MLCLVWGFVEKIIQGPYEMHVMSAVPHQKAAFAAGFSIDGPFTPDIKLLLYTAIKAEQQQQSIFSGIPTFTVGLLPLLNSFL